MGKVKQLTVGEQVMLIFGLICAILVAIGLFLFFSLHALERRNQEMQSQILVEWMLNNDLARDVMLEQGYIFQHVQTQDTEEMKRLDETISRIKEGATKNWNKYETLVDNETEKQLYSKALQARKEYWKQSDWLLALTRTNPDLQAKSFALSQQAPAYEEYQKAIGDIAEWTAKEAGEMATTSTLLVIQTRKIGDTLVVLAILITVATGIALVRITRRLKEDNIELQAEVEARKQAEEDLRGKTAFLEAQINSSIDGIVVVDSQGRTTLQNKRMNELWEMPPSIVEDEDSKRQVEWVTSMTKNPERFVESVNHLYSHPDEISRDEIELKNGTVIDRYSSPVIGKDGKYYGRIWLCRDITEHKLAEQRLVRLRNEHSAVLNSVSEGVHWIGENGQIRFENSASAKMLGYEISELIGKPAHLTMHHSHADGSAYPVAECPIYATLKDGAIRHVKDEVFWRKDGTSFPVEYTATPVEDENGHPAGTVVVFTDVTDRKRLEARMFQSQKMETVGKLAGGVAHEFNSILTAIIGQSELMLGDLPPEDPLVKNAREIRQASERAAILTRQLLAYGRKQILQPEVLDLNLVLTDMVSTLQHLMGREVDVRIVPAVGLEAVKIDPGQMEQVIVNIAMNAADAMPNGGKFTLETANVTLDEEYVRSFPGLKPGGYVMLALTDTGTGMTDEVKTRVFEPFFSTKAVGQGTGLGLATCYGIIKQSDGHINVYSEIARGTTFKIYLPQVEQPAKTALPRLSSPDLPRGTETILLAEDDPSLCEMSATLLRRLGYTVLTAVNGVEALALKNQRDIGHIDLLFTDIVMPHMSGKELSDRIRAIYPHTKILFTSAYTESAIAHQGMLKEGVTLLQKPFTPSALANKVREVLDR
jgi:PAS domain S-box-containing protein